MISLGVHRFAKELCFVLLVISTKALGISDAPVKRPMVYFHNTETSINNFSALKTSFDTFLKNHTPHTFQPIKKKETFEQKILSTDTGSLFILSSWHFKELNRKQYTLQPVLIGSSNGRHTQSVLLLSKLKSIQALKSKTIATSGTIDYATNILSKIVGKENQHLLNSIQILKVPKDIDALLSVGFGVADAAISTQDNFDQLFYFNRKQFEKLRPLGEAQDRIRILVAAKPSQVSSLQTTIAALKEMGQTPGLNKPLKLLGLDNFIQVEENVSKLLNL